MKLRPAILLLLTATLFACAAPPPPPPPEAKRPPLGELLAGLPGAEVTDGEAPVISYPGESLFAAGAALPLPGGTAVLDPLAELLLTYPEVRGSGAVRAATDVSPDYDRRLAEKRAELLGLYLENRGLGGRLPLTPAAGDGAPLEIVLETGAQESAASSSREN